MHKKLFLFTALMAFCVSNGLAQIEPAAGIRENTPAVHALKKLTIIVAPGKRIEKGTIVVRGGVIESAGANVAIPADARVWDCSGLTAYAGLIDLYTDIGQPKPPVQGQPSSPASTAPPRPARAPLPACSAAGVTCPSPLPHRLRRSLRPTRGLAIAPR